MTEDLTDRLNEQLTPIVETLQIRAESNLTDRDKVAIAHALVDAANMGARVGIAWVVANAVDAGLEIPIDVSGLRSRNLWPDDA